MECWGNGCSSHPAWLERGTALGWGEFGWRWPEPDSDPGNKPPLMLQLFAGQMRPSIPLLASSGQAYESSWKMISPALKVAQEASTPSVSRSRAMHLAAGETPVAVRTGKGSGNSPLSYWIGPKQSEPVILACARLSVLMVPMTRKLVGFRFWTDRRRASFTGIINLWNLLPQDGSKGDWIHLWNWTISGVMMAKWNHTTSE